MDYSQLPVSPLKQPKSFNFATHIVDHWAEKNPTQTALYWVSQDLKTSKKLTYKHFSRQSHRIASLLYSLGIKQGEVCIIILPRLPEWWEIVTACLRSGIIPCPCTTLLVDKDIEYRLQVSNATTFIGDSVSVAKCLKIKAKCPNLKTIIQIDGPESTTSSSSSPPTNPSNIINFNTALSRISQDAHFPTPSTLKPTSPGLIFFTSGTTGPPKIVLHTQISYPLAHALTGLHWLDLKPHPSSIYWNLSEQGWAKAAWSFFATWNCGATLFIHDDRRPFNPKTTIEILHKYPISTLCAPPTVYRQLVLTESRKIYQSPQGKPKSLIHCCGAGEPLNESVIRTWKEMNDNQIEILDGYGQTETILTCANQKGMEVKMGSMGRPVPGVSLRIIDGDGNDTKNGEEGDIAVEILDDEESSDYDGGGGGNSFFGLFAGYIKDMKSLTLDRKIFVSSSSKKGGKPKKFYVTGDRAARDEDGYFWFVGRNDDVINSSGYRIGPFEVESTLKLHPDVIESAVVASPDPRRDEVVKAFIVLTQEAFQKLKTSNNRKEEEGKLIKELQDFCKRNAAPYKYPRKMEFVEAEFLPKTISGKIRRGELKVLERDRYNKENGRKGKRAKL